MDDEEGTICPILTTVEATGLDEVEIIEVDCIGPRCKLWRLCTYGLVTPR